MIKQEIKVELSNNDKLNELIQKTYFSSGQKGRILGGKQKTYKIENKVNYKIFKGLNNLTAKITNKDLIEGTMRFIVSEKNDEIELIPISVYCIVDNDKYIFY